jgi:hypothetical protein
MASIINSTTTSPGGLISTGDSSNSLLIQTGDTTAITVSSGQVVTLAQPLPVASGGTGVTSSATAPFALKGANSDITSLSGLTTALSIAQGGTSATSATAAFNALNPMTTTGDMLYEASPTTAARLPIGSSGQILTVSGGIPTWAAAPAGGVTSVATGNGLSGGTITSTGTLVIAAPTYNSIGSYVLGIPVNSESSFVYNSTYSASNIGRGGITGIPNGCNVFLSAGSAGTGLSGTWRAMSNANNQNSSLALMVRVS